MMYSIGILSVPSCADNLCAEGGRTAFNIQYICLEDILYTRDEWDILIVNEIDNTQIYEVILQIRAHFNGCLLLRTSNRTKVTDLIYLHLGVDGIVSEAVDGEVLFIQISRLLELFKTSERIAERNEKSGEELELCQENLSVLKNNEEIELTKKEYVLLAHLMAYPGIALSYKELHQKVWKQESNTENQALVANVVFHLRSKLGRNQKGKEYILTVRTKGYKFCQ